MTAEAGECNGRSEGWKGDFEAEGGGDLKDSGIACRDGDEIGGSYVIVNGDSDDHSDRDLDLEARLDSEAGTENGGSRSEDEGGGGAVESSDDDDKLGEKQENGNLVEERSNGDDDREENENATGSGSDIKESGSDVKIEDEHDRGLEPTDAVDEKQDSEVLPAAEVREAVIAESESKPQLGCEVERGDPIVQESAVVLEGSGSAFRVGEVVDVIAEGESKLELELQCEVELEDRIEPESAVLEGSGSAFRAGEMESAIAESESKPELGCEVELEDRIVPECAVVLEGSGSAFQVGEVEGVIAESESKSELECEVEREDQIVPDSVAVLEGSGSALRVDEAEEVEAVIAESESKPELECEVEREDQIVPESMAVLEGSGSALREDEVEAMIAEGESKLELGCEVGPEDRIEPESVVLEGSGSALRVDEVEAAIAEGESKLELGCEAGPEDRIEPETVVLEGSGSALRVDEVEAAIAEGESKLELGCEVGPEDRIEPETVVLEGSGSAFQVGGVESVIASKLELGCEVVPEDRIEPESVVLEGSGSAFRLGEVEAVIAEGDSKLELGCEVEPENRIELESVVLEESGSAFQIGELEVPVSILADAGGNGVMSIDVEESEKPVDGFGETESVAESIADAQPEQKQEVVETENVAGLESAVEAVEATEEPSYGIRETEKSVEEGSAIEAIDVQLQQHEKLPEASLPNCRIDDNEKSGKISSAIEVEPSKEFINRIEDTADERSAVEVESEQDPSNGTEVESEQEPCNGVEDTGEVTEVGSVVKCQLKRELYSVVEKMENAEEPKVVIEENGFFAERGSAVKGESEQEPEPVLGAVDRTEAGEIKERDDEVALNAASEHPLLENGIAGTSKGIGDALRDQPSDQVDNKSTDSLEDVSNGEGRDVQLENSEILISCNSTAEELAEEVGDDEKVQMEVEVSNEVAVPPESKTVVSSEEIEPCSSSPVKVSEIEAKNFIENVETNEDVPVEGIKVDSTSQNESTECRGCINSSVEGGISKNDDEESSEEQSLATKTIQASPDAHIVRRQPVFMIKVPRFVDDELQKEIDEASAYLQEKTEVRNSKGGEIGKHTKIVTEYFKEHQAELAKERAVRSIFNGKRKELECVQESIARINNANSIADIDEKIRNMVHRQQHETMSLKQEKQYIHDINQMKRLREQLSSKKASQEQIDEVFSQREELEARVKNLKKELDSLRASLASAESSRQAAWDKFKAEDRCLKNLRDEHDAAAVIREEAYLRWRKLIDKSIQKGMHFKRYKADQSTAKNYIFSGDSQGLISHCHKQVERIMDRWNNHSEFREQYMKSNMYSTLKRLGTPDGRSLGPDESPPVLQFHRGRNSNLFSAPSSNVGSSAPVFASEAKQENMTEPSATKRVARSNQSALLKSSAKPFVVGGGTLAVSNGETAKQEEKKKKPKKEQEEQALKAEELTRKEEELRKEKAAKEEGLRKEKAAKEEELRKEKAAKEEELRKEKAAAEFREKLRLEQKAKAKEAEERKRRKAEKALAKAEYRVQKEAEEKKKAKKVNKKSGKAETISPGTEEGSTPVPETILPETSQESETSSGASSRKRSSRPASSVRQFNRVQAPVPLPLRSKSKRKMRTFIWTSLVVLLVLILFFAGNYISFPMSSLLDFGF